MRIAVFLNQLGLGGSEKAACLWAHELTKRGHEVHVISLADGPRREELERNAIELSVVRADAAAIRFTLQRLQPDVIHVHAPGHPHKGDVLGGALAHLPKIPVVQTNIFGQMENPRENAWTDFRLFISWTSCVQAARRSFQRLDEKFFRRASVAVYPIDVDNGPQKAEAEAFRRNHGVSQEEVLFGRLSRPEPNKWTDLPIKAFRLALQRNTRLKLLLREPPAEVARALHSAPDYEHFLILPSTSDRTELALTMASLDVVLHTSIIGESFGYGMAEPMNYGKPVITNSTPWLDQAQIELVRDGKCGFVASTPRTMASAILKLANDGELRTSFGCNAQAHIRKLADPAESTLRLETVLHAVVSKQPNPYAPTDLIKARATAAYLDREQFGHSLREWLGLRPLYYRVRFHQLRRKLSGHL